MKKFIIIGIVAALLGWLGVYWFTEKIRKEYFWYQR